MLISSIPDNSTVLPDDENGIVLLSHIRQHLESGLGLRQIIDWMMFVRSYLNDEMWFSSFHEKAQRTGLESLAVITTKMCQKYLGLTKKDLATMVWSFFVISSKKINLRLDKVFSKH